MDSDVIPAICITISGAYLGGLFLQGIMFIIGDGKRRNKTRVMPGSVEVCVQKVVGIVGQQRRLVGNSPWNHMQRKTKGAE